MVGQYKRIYIGAGAGILTIVSLFLILNSIGIQIDSDGDKTCVGTIEDPCISYVTVNNPTAKSVYI